MQRCFQLARLGAGSVAPNPMVGAVLVHGDRIIGEGYHKQFGQAHAEVNCINAVREADKHLVAQSTLYVSLEPCAHFGKTPPCADLVIHHQIPTVVIGCADSFEQVSGKGIERLKKAGIEVITGVLEQEARQLNQRFFTFHEKKRPFIVLKWAQSSDAKISLSSGERVFISNEMVNRFVHRWRSEEAGIMIGTNTALLDDPSLTTRHWPGNHPLRIVLDQHLRLPASLHVMDGTVPTLVLNGSRMGESANLRFEKINMNGHDLKPALDRLFELGVSSVLVEGGTALLQSFIDQGCWDEARVITNDALVIGEGLSAPHTRNMKPVSMEPVGNNTIHYYSNPDQ